MVIIAIVPSLLHYSIKKSYNDKHHNLATCRIDCCHVNVSPSSCSWRIWWIHGTPLCSQRAQIPEPAESCRSIMIYQQDQGLPTEALWTCLSPIHLIHHVKPLEWVPGIVDTQPSILYLKKSWKVGLRMISSKIWSIKFMSLPEITKSCFGVHFMWKTWESELSFYLYLLSLSQSKVCWNSSAGTKHGKCGKTWKNPEELEDVGAFSEGTGQVPPRASGSGPHLVSLLSTLVLFNWSQFCSR